MPPFLFTYIAGIFGAICIGVGATIYYKRRSELLGAPLALLIGAAGVWSLANSFADISYTHNMIVLWSGVALIGFQFMASFLLNLVTHFVDKTRRLALWQRIAFYGPTIVISLLAFSTLSIKETFVIYDAPAQILIGPIYLVGPIFLYLAFFYSYYRLLRGFRLRDRRTQLQIRYIILGTAFTLLGLTIFDIILPFFGELRFFSVGPVSTIFMVAAFSYTILRHHLIDLRIAMQRGLIYTILLVIIVLIYLGLVFFIGTMLERFTPLTAIISAGLTTALGIFGVPPIARYFRKATDKIFFKDRYNYSDSLRELSEILNTTLDLDKLIARTTKELQRIMKAEYVKIHVDGEKPVLENDTDLVLPIVLDNKTKGYIALGKKKSDDPYSTEDFSLLTTFSYQAGIALEKAKLYQQAKEHAQDLEVQVANRTEQLQSLQQLQEQMMVDISHSLQTPLTIMRGEIDTLKSIHGVDEGRLGAFEKSITDASKFIYDLLKLSRLESTELQEEHDTVDMSALLDELVEYFTTLTENANVKLYSEIDPDVSVLGSKDKLKDLVVTVVSNAMKYMSSKDPRSIGITLKKTGGNATLTINDTGVGIKTEDLPHIFDRFYRSKDTKTRGSGLGLSIAQEIVKQHGGSITATSEHGKGSTFTISLPLA